MSECRIQIHNLLNSAPATFYGLDTARGVWDDTARTSAERSPEGSDPAPRTSHGAEQSRALQDEEREKQNLLSACKQR